MIDLWSKPNPYEAIRRQELEGRMMMAGIYELREYVATSERVQALHKRFEDHTLVLLQRHGIRVVGLWNDADDPERLILLLHLEAESDRAAAWKSFVEDPEWKKIKRASEADGPLVSEMHSTVLEPVPYFDTPLDV